MSGKDVTISLTYSKDEGKLHIDLGDTSLKSITIDFSKITGGEARALLAASVAECMGSWLLHFLRRHEENLAEFRIIARTSTSIVEEENVVDKITLEVHVKIAGSESDYGKYEKIIRRIIAKGCLISRSLENGIKVEYVPRIEKL